MDVEIREILPADRTLWAEMRHRLWPEESPAEHLAYLERVLKDGLLGAYVAMSGGAPVGFAEIGVRPYANGCEQQPVAFLEGIWVAPTARRGGIARDRITHVSAALRARGFSELGSDALLANTASHAAHHDWGFAETERVVYFRKPL